MTIAPNPAPRTAAALAARHRTTDAMLDRVTEAIRHLGRERGTVSFAAVARRAGVSRTFLYENPTARQSVTEAAGRGSRSGDNRDGQAAGDDQPWRERARNAEEALKAAHAEVRRQRDTIADLLGRVRDLEDDDARDVVGRLTAANTALDQRVSELVQHNRTLEERLQAARATARFLDKRVADLEAGLLGDYQPTGAAR